MHFETHSNPDRQAEHNSEMAWQALERAGVTLEPSLKPIPTEPGLGALAAIMAGEAQTTAQPVAVGRQARQLAWDQAVRDAATTVSR